MAEQPAIALTLLFDGYCGFCTWAAGWLVSLDRRGLVAIIPCQSDDQRPATGVSRHDCKQAAWAVDRHGRRYRGAGAILAGLAVGLDWGVPLLLYQVAPLRWAADAGYWLIARLRRWLPGVKPYCLQHPAACGRSS